jgi:hypothetical protein
MTELFFIIPQTLADTKVTVNLLQVDCILEDQATPAEDQIQYKPIDAYNTLVELVILDGQDLTALVQKLRTL